jgi:outer membrane protein OmpA-like peptidoglycan-associated protein
LPADPAAAQALARTRAEAVRAALLDHGVDAARVRIAEPKAQPADEEGVPTELALLALK